MDRHAVHKTNKVSPWLEKNRERIRLFFLPAYHPELNPDELLNQDLEGNAFRQRRARDKRDMMVKFEGLFTKQSASASKSQKVFRRRCRRLCGRGIVNYFLLPVIRPFINTLRSGLLSGNAPQRRPKRDDDGRVFHFLAALPS